MIKGEDTKKVFNGLWFSDQHTLHNKTPTTWILKNMSDFVYRETDLSKIDIVIFGGDLFDLLVDAADNNLRLVQHWIRDFLIQCSKYEIVVRVLEGTRSHDMEQPETFVVQKPEGLDLKWIKDISVEYIEKLDLSVMYVPDNLGHMKEIEIWDTAIDVLSKAGMTSVNLMCTHTMWDYQAPPHIAHKFRDSKLWMSIVDHIIFTGHVHIPSEYKKLRSSGSFDRLRYGEEHPKGAYKFSFNIQDNYFETKFWENKKALPYITIRKDEHDDVDALSSKIEHIIENNNLPINSRIMIKGKDGSLINSVLERYKKTHPQINFDVDTSDAKKEMITEQYMTNDVYHGIGLDKDNLTPSLMKFLNKNEDDELAGLLAEFL